MADAGLDHFEKRIDAMEAGMLASKNKYVLPSEYWLRLNEKHRKFLREYEYGNFKRNVNLSYFNWVSPYQSGQLDFFWNTSRKFQLLKNFIKAASLKHRELSFKKSLIMNFTTFLLWNYAASVDREGLLKKVCEPIEGNPFGFYVGGRLVSQDLANSFLEYRSIVEGSDLSAVKIILEVGGGYGRNAYMFLKVLDGIKYVMSDIPPALAIAERYLTSQFPHKKIFAFRDFKSFDEIKDEFEKADLLFLLPHQLELLPQKYFDLFINISSFHEMTLDQIRYYFRLIDRLVSKYVYLKEWRVAKIPFNGHHITEADYPYYPHWSTIYQRTCKVQTAFFEIMLKLN